VLLTDGIPGIVSPTDCRVRDQGPSERGGLHLKGSRELLGVSIGFDSSWKFCLPWQLSVLLPWLDNSVKKFLFLSSEVCEVVIVGRHCGSVELPDTV